MCSTCPVRPAVLHAVVFHKCLADLLFCVWRGDGLGVLPLAFWYHYVEGGDSTAISLAFLSPSPEEEALGQLVQAPHPWPDTFTVAQRAVVARSILSVLLDALYGPESAVNFVQQVLLQTRYRHLREELLTRAPLAGELARTHCYADDGGSAQVLAFDTFEEAAAPLQVYMEGVVRLVMEKLRTSPHHQHHHQQQQQTQAELRPGVAEIVLGNYVEVLARAAVGLPNVAAFLVHCFPRV